MIQTTVVANCLLYKDKNESLYKYFDEITPKFSFLVRRTYHHLSKDLNGEELSKYRTRMKNDYGLTNRFAKAVVNTANNLLKLSVTSNEYLYSTYDKKLKRLEVKILKTKAILNNPKIDKSRRKRLKTKLFWLEMKKNRLKQLKDNGPRRLVTLGSKSLLRNDKERFIKKRDNQIVYIGAKNENLGNQQFKIFYDVKSNKFTYKIRLEDQYINDSKYIYGEFIMHDKNAKKEILRTLNTPNSNPLTYRVIRQGDKLQLQIMYRVCTGLKTRNYIGVIGVDFNKGFIAVSEIDEKGKLLNIDRLTYIHKGKVGVTKNSMLHLVKGLVDLAVTSGKDIVIEDLKSLNKNKQEKTEQKHYNRMINTLKFGRFRDLLQMKCDKCGVTLVTVNPYNTSKIAKEKYCYDMKLNIHSGASYVIARRFYNLD